MGVARGLDLGVHGAGVAAAGGHEALTVDLPSYDPSARLEDYADLALAALPDGAEHLVVVGHSLGGLVAPLIAEQQRAADRVPVRLRARSSAELEPKASKGTLLFSHRAGTIWPVVRSSARMVRPPWPADAAIEAMYHDCALDRAMAASQRLRPQHWGPTRQTRPLSSWPEKHYTWVCVGDRIVSPTWQRASARERGGTVVELSGVTLRCCPARTHSGTS